MKRRDEVLVGILVTVALLVGILGTVWLARGGLYTGYSLYAYFPWGAGLKQGQPVLLAGVTIGSVDEVALLPEGRLLTTMRIEDEYAVPEGSVAMVVPIGIFGDAAVALTPPSMEAAVLRNAYEAGDTLPTAAPPPGITDIVAKLDTVVSTVSDVTQAVELQLVAEGGLADLRQTIAATNRLVLQLNAIAAEQARELSVTTAALRRTATAIDSAELAATVTNLRQATENLSQLMASLTVASEQLTSVLTKADTGSGTVAQLLNDPSLYVQLRQTVSSLDSLIADIQRNPRRYINLEIF